MPHLLIIDARFYDDLADELVKGAVAALERAGATYDHVSVPGAFEVPAAVLDGVVGLDPPQALRARAAAAATPTAFEIRPKRIPPPCFCGVVETEAVGTGQTSTLPQRQCGPSHMA